VENNNPLIPSDAVQAIKDSVATTIIEISGEDYTSRPVFVPPAEAKDETLDVHTLSGVIDYLSANIDEALPAAHAIHIVGPSKVNLVSLLDGRPRRREVLVSAGSDSLGFRFGQFYSCEEFTVALQSLFVDDGDRAAVLALTGTIKESVVGEFSDDGVTQTVVASAGIARVGEVRVPNPVNLSPYRTFPEVSQPTSPFVLRMKRGLKDGEMPSCALFEADGGKWKLAAIENIAKYLRIRIAELKDPMNKIAIIA
jgi:hypothetical protein